MALTENIKLMLALDQLTQSLNLDLPSMATNGLFQDVLRYLEIGNQDARDVVLSQTTQGFIYFIHEAVEINEIRPYLDEPAPPRKSGKMKFYSEPAPSDPWAESFFRLNKRRPGEEHSRGRLADMKARVAENNLERLFAFIFFDISLPLEAYIMSLSSAPGKPLTVNTEITNAAIRDQTLKYLGSNKQVSIEDTLAAEQARARVWNIHLESFLKFQSISELAYIIWLARDSQHGHDLGDWLAAEKIFKIIRD